MRYFRIFRLVCGLALFCCASSRPASAQADLNFEMGVLPFASYHGGNIDTINVLNGQLALDIPLISYPQRGGKLKLDFHLRYANVGSTATYACFVGPGGQTCVWVPCPAGGFQISSCTPPILGHGFGVTNEGFLEAFPSQVTVTSGSNSYWERSVAVVMPDGSQHPMAPTSSTQWESVDATAFQYSWSSTSSGPLVDANGTKYGTTIEDTNGNTITGSSSGWTDTMGRVIPAVPAATSNVAGCPQPPSVPYAPSSAATWNPPGVNGGQYPVLFCYVQLTETNPIGATCNSGQTLCPYTYTGTELQSVVLPDGTSWEFQYTTDGNADLAEVIFPTGGSLSYGSWGQTCLASENCSAIYNRAVGTRTLNPNDGVTPASTWSYSYGNLTTTVSAPPSSGSTPDDTVHTFTVFGSCSSYGPGRCNEYETQTQYYQGSHSSGTLLKTVTTQYSYSYDSTYSYSNWLTNVVPTQITTTWANSQQAKTVYTYDSNLQFYRLLFSTSGVVQGTTSSGTYGRLLTKQEYDYGGSLLRTTTTAYLALNNSSYLSANLLSLPSSVQVTGSGPGSLTNYSYDQNNGSPQGVLGNLTSTSRWLNTTSSYFTSTNIYNSNGLVTTTKDPYNNPTTYGYTSPCYAGSGPTSVANALGQTTNYCYDSQTGLLTSTTDPNNQTTSYVYDDMLRTTQINYPDGGQTDLSYSAQLDGWTATIKEKMDTVPDWRTSNVWVDGLGRKGRADVYNSEPTPWDEVGDACYNGRGLVSFKAYPYQDWGWSSLRTCTAAGDSFTYDALNRTTSITHSDGSSVVTSYTGRATSVQDEGNGTQSVQRISQVDGLGRVTSLCEVTSTTLTVGITGSTTPTACGQDIAATGFLTTYSYDALDNLTSVSQGPLNARTFVYDSLSRLTSATNPESGTTTYTYDADNNLLTKTDARNIKITYAYDVLNRIASKTYSDGTPTVYYYYDDASIWGISLTNPIGRLSFAGTSNPANNWWAGEVFGYDQMGRVVTNSQCTPQNCPAKSTFPVSYAYDLIGDMTSFTNGAGVTLTGSYNNRGRLTKLTSSVSDSNHPGTLFGYQNPAHYNAAGAILSVTLGNGVNETRTYDGRLRLTGITDGSLYTLTIPTSNGYAANSDLLGANDSVNGNWTYGYDPFNRLISSNQNSGATTFTYAYDRFGNRWNQSVTHGSGPHPNYGFDANNHITASYGVTYDAAGNTTNDGTTTYTYDAEGRVLTAANNSSGTSTYVYDAEGRRIRKTTVAGGTVDFIYDLAGHEITAFTTAGQAIRDELYAGSRHLGTYLTTSPMTWFIYSDWLGTERFRSPYTAGTNETCTSLPFGDALSCTGTDVSPMHFTGKERDSESGLDHFQFRNLASTMGRFMSPDPINLTAKRVTNPANTLNKYVYGGNDPLLYVDPTGRDITVFYRAPSGAPLDFGHIMLAVTNQDTGQVRFADYYNGNGNTRTGPGVMNQNEPTDRLKGDAALTIQTTPEVAQKLIDAIDALSQNTPTYSFPFQDCSTVCADLLNMAGIEAPSFLASPTDIWSSLYSNYSSEALAGGQLRMGMYRYQAGRDFGVNMSVFPNGTDPGLNLELLYRLVEQQRAQQQNSPKACVSTLGPNGWVTTCD